MFFHGCLALLGLRTALLWHISLCPAFSDFIADAFASTRTFVFFGGGLAAPQRYIRFVFFQGADCAP